LPARTSVAPAVLALRRHDLTMVRRSEQLRADFIANASHELRTPLAAVSGFIETLRGHAKDDPDAREQFLSIMAVEAARMRRLIDDLLEYMVQPGAEYRHAWEPGDLVIWDNRSSIHANAGGYRLSERRTNWRVILMEDRADSSLGRAA